MCGSTPAGRVGWLAYHVPPANIISVSSVGKGCWIRKINRTWPPKVTVYRGGGIEAHRPSVTHGDVLPRRDPRSHGDTGQSIAGEEFWVTSKLHTEISCLGKGEKKHPGNGVMRPREQFGSSAGAGC